MAKPKKITVKNISKSAQSKVYTEAYNPDRSSKTKSLTTILFY